MSYTAEPGALSEEVENIFDCDGREYHLEIDYFFDENCQSQAIYFFLNRCERNNRVGYAYCLIEDGNLKIADFLIYDDQTFQSGIDKLFKLTHWNEPTNYRNKTLGTQLLQHIINVARRKGIHEIVSKLTYEDRTQQPFLIGWYEKHGFTIDPKSYQIRFTLA